jgi:fumarate hydratase class I
MENFYESMYQLIVETSTNLPKDVRRAIAAAKLKESAGTRSAMSLATITNNIKMADENISPICQDTGLPTFKLKVPVGANQIEMKKEIKRAIEQATKDGKLRPNSVDSISGANSGDNLGDGTPVIKFEQWEKDYIDARLILKGG